MKQLYITIILILSLIIIMLGIGLWVQNCEYSQNNFPNSIRIDTVITILPQKVIKIDSVKPQIKYIRDTIIQTQPFIAQIDTVYLMDTLQAEYQFPENMFRIAIATHTDTLRELQIKQVEVNNEQSKWHLPVAIIGGFIIGYAIGR